MSWMISERLESLGVYSRIYDAFQKAISVQADVRVQTQMLYAKHAARKLTEAFLDQEGVFHLNASGHVHSPDTGQSYINISLSLEQP